MQVIDSIHEMQSHAVALRSRGGLIGFAPTMGSLHEGHLSLIDIAKEQADAVVVSIFVNPTQFGPNEDYDRYPRQLAKDIEMCEARGADIVFTPKKEALYPDGYSTYVLEESVAADLEGVSRPQFFKGVCTVVAKLFNIVRPDIAVFGQKDAQQAAVIRKMADDLHFPVDIVVAPTVREPDGLAMSSRNAYLNPEQRRHALTIYQALLKGKTLVEQGTLNADRVVAEITNALSASARLRVIYVSAADSETMKPLKQIAPGKTTLSTAVWVDETRLIDNLLV